MRLSVMVFGLVCVCALVIGIAAPVVQDDEDVRGAFLTSRPKEKPASSSTTPSQAAENRNRRRIDQNAARQWSNTEPRQTRRTKPGKLQKPGHRSTVFDTGNACKRSSPRTWRDVVHARLERSGGACRSGSRFQQRRSRANIAGNQHATDISTSSTRPTTVRRL